MTDKKLSAAREAELLTEARTRFDRCVDAERVMRAEAIEDLRFRAGEQWPESVRRDREAEGRPVLTINRLGQFVRQVTGDIRLNRPAIRVRPVDDRADVSVAKVLTGLIRHIEQVSMARVAYVTAAENAATCGMGAFRVVTEYSRDDGFDQDIRIRRVPSPFAIYFDPDATELTREDARFAFVVDRLPLDEFKLRYPKASTQGFAGRMAEEGALPWWDGERVTVAEYWRKEPATRVIGLTADGRSIELDNVGEAERKRLGIVRTRVVETHRVVQYLIGGDQVLDGPNEWAGRYIPLVPVFGEEIHVGERAVRHGVIRFARDPQRLYNYWRSNAAELVALAPKAPFIGTVKQFAGHERFWQQANRAGLPYLPYTPDPGAPPPQRQGLGDVPTAVLTEAGMAADDIKAVTGIYDAGLGAQSNETSGRAILFRQREGDIGAYVYADHLAVAIEHAGRILVDLIPRVYDSERIVRVLGDDDSERFVPVNAVVPTADGPKVLNDLSLGEYDVAVTVGPSFTTRREAAAESMMAFVQANPQTASVVMDLIAKNMDWPGADEIAERLRKLLPPELRGEAPAPAAPDPLAGLVVAQQTANVARERGDALKIQAEAEAQGLANVERKIELAQQPGAVEAVVRQAVAGALRQILGGGNSAGGPRP